MKKLLYNLTVALTESAGSVCFVGVYMHSGRKLRTDSYDNISEQCASFRIDFYGNDIFVFYSGSFGIFGSHVDMALCNNNTAVEVNFATRSDQLTSGRSRKIATFTDRGGDSERTRIGEGYLNLRRGAGRTENDNIRNGFFRTYDCSALFTGVLTGLTEILFLSKGSAFSVEGFNMRSVR